MQVDADLWLCALDLATIHGWRPLGIVTPTGPGAGDHLLHYFRPDGQSVTKDDASELARCLETALPGISDTVVELNDRSFGEDHTMELLRRAFEGKTPHERDAQGAVEILSGPPKGEALALIEFLRGGPITLHSANSSLGTRNHG